MSQRLINRSADLKRLRDEGYDVKIVGNNLVVGSVPYVNAQKQVKLGTLVSELTLVADMTAKPGDHVIHFAGDCPCDKNGSALAKILLNNEVKDHGQGLVTHHSFSSKPKPDGYLDYYHKVTSYIAILLTQAQALDPSVTPKTFPPIPADEKESVFYYVDTASSRADIGAATAKLEVPTIAIIGLGGTGAYVLDLTAKTPVVEIQLYDGDKLQQHTAFRSPGAASLGDLEAQPFKVHYYQAIYSKMRRNIIAHPVYIDATNVHELREMSHVFVCLDKGKVKPLIIQSLEEAGVPFIDVGIGVQLIDGALLGIVRTTTSTPRMRDHIPRHVSFADEGGENDYAKNIQIADLNALNAALAVIKWKKLCGFYHDLDHEHQSLYTISGNTLSNTEKP
jgi:hypothetical protein